MSDTLARKMKQVTSLYVTINCKKRGRKFQEAQYKEQHTNEHSTSAKEDHYCVLVNTKIT